MEKKLILSELAAEIKQAVVTDLHLTENCIFEEDTDLFDITTDKAVITITAPFRAQLKKWHIQKNSELNENSLVATIELKD